MTNLMLPAVASGTPTLNRIHNCSAMTLLKALPDNCIDCVVTSPPYFGLRSYLQDGDVNKSHEIGLEPTPAAYVQTLVTLFREVRRVLKDSGTFWLNLGDSYNGSGKGWTGHNGIGNQEQRQGFKSNPVMIEGLAPKNLMLIPHRVAIALQDDGWICRQDNVWAKPNPMPESVTDRTTRAHEYIFQFVKSGRYYYNAEAVAEPVTRSTIERLSQDVANQTGSTRVQGKTNGNMKAVIKKQDDLGKRQYTGFNDRYFAQEQAPTRNKRSVWTISPAQFREAHFATFPFEIPETCIRAGCPVGGVVLDPFGGSGTTGYVAQRLGRDFIMSELNPAYVEMSRKRLAEPFTPDLFLHTPVSYDTTDKAQQDYPVDSPLPDFGISERV